MPVPKFIVIAVAAIILTLHQTGESTAGTKTLTRVDDPIIMDASGLRDLFGIPIEHLTLMIFHKNTWKPIPFQIDQKKPDGKYAFTNGPNASEDTDPTLDANDELVFMVKDSGDRMPSDHRPSDAQSIAEITLTDPGNGNQGWVYLVAFNKTAPRSQTDYISLTFQDNGKYRCVKTYEYEMRGASDRIFPDYLAMSELADGRPGVDILDRMKIRGTIKFPLGIKLSPKFEEIFKCRDMAYIDGPVRVLLDAAGYMELLGFVKIKGKQSSTISWYVNHLICRIVMDVPMVDTGIVDVKELEGYLDFNENMYGAHAFDGANPFNENVVLDGCTSDTEKHLDTQTDIDWIAGIGPNAAIVSRLFWVPRPSYLLQTLHFTDDKNQKEPPESHSGVCGVGYSFKDFMEKRKDGTPPVIDLYFYAKRDITPDAINRILDILDAPVIVDVTAGTPAELSHVHRIQQ